MPAAVCRYRRIYVFAKVYALDNKAIEHPIRARSGRGMLYGWVAERLKAPVLKTGRPNGSRGFESHPIRQ